MLLTPFSIFNGDIQSSDLSTTKMLAIYLNPTSSCMSIQIEAPQFEREKGTNKTNNKKQKERDKPIVPLRSHKETNPMLKKKKRTPSPTQVMIIVSFLAVFYTEFSCLPKVHKPTFVDTTCYGSKSNKRLSFYLAESAYKLL